MPILGIEVEKCNQGCPFVVSYPARTYDWFECASDYYCGKGEERKIAGYVEHDWEMPEIPEWCPIIIER